MKVIAIGDLHFPYANKGKVRKAIKRIKKEHPDVVIQLGDLFDQYMFGRFDKSLNFISPDKELEKAKKQAVDFWANVKKVAPKAKRIQLLGNHDVRILKQCLSRFPEIYGVIEKAHMDLYSFDGVEVKKSDRDYVVFDGVVYCHGWAATHTEHFGQPVVRCHDHKAWIRIEGRSKQALGKLRILNTFTLHRSEDVVFEISAGMFADSRLLPFGYSNSRRTNWKPAIGIITKETACLEVL